MLLVLFVFFLMRRRPPRSTRADILVPSTTLFRAAAALSNIKAGKLRVLATATPERLALLPNVPTMDEAGVKNFTAYAWQGVVGPAGLPQAIVDKDRKSTRLNSSH